MNISGRDNEQHILDLFRRGDSSAMDVLYACYADYLTGVCYRYITNDEDLKDVLQESFIKIFTQISSFEYRGSGSLQAWMTRIAVNESLQLLRRRKNDPLLFDTELPDLPDEDPDTDELTPEVLVRLLRKLPEGYRTVLNLYVIEGKSHKEIAELLHIKPDSSASQLHRAKNMLAHFINEYKSKLV